MKRSGKMIRVGVLGFLSLALLAGCGDDKNKPVPYAGPTGGPGYQNPNGQRPPAGQPGGIPGGGTQPCVGGQCGGGGGGSFAWDEESWYCESNFPQEYFWDCYYTMFDGGDDDWDCEDDFCGDGFFAVR